MHKTYSEKKNEIYVYIGTHNLLSDNSAIAVRGAPQKDAEQIMMWMVWGEADLARQDHTMAGYTALCNVKRRQDYAGGG